MKIATSFFALILSLFVITVKAQMYQQGDVTVMLQPNSYHDSTICGTTGQMVYQITVLNSFVGDSVIVKDMSNGMVLYAEGNTTGQNPWLLMAPNWSASGFVQDNQLVSGEAIFYGPPSKVISGTDTVYDINNTFSTFVNNPCIYGDVTGVVYVDNNNDCSYNSGDVALNAIPVVSNIALNSPSQSTTAASGYADANGMYNVLVQESWMTGYTVSIPSYYQFIFPSTACSPTSYSFTTLPQVNVNFSLQCSSNVDVQAFAGSQGFARPNVPFYLTPSVSNTGCDAASGQLKLVLDPNVVYDASQSTNPADAVNGDTLTWNYTDLSNLSNGMYWNSFMSSIHLTPTLSVNAGDSLCFHVFTNVPSADINAWNNDYAFCIPVVNSHDPNVKEVTPRGTGNEGSIPQNTNELTYTIHFQNTGNAAAYNVSVVDTLDGDVQANSLRIVAASHAMTPEWLAPNIVRFNFYGIMLADSTSNEAASHGFVTFKISPNANLPIGTQIKNTGYIYFDFNTPVVTNTTLNTIAEPNAVAALSNDNALVAVYPNPATDAFFVNKPNVSSSGYDIRIENQLGQIVYALHTNQAQQTVDAPHLSSGIYMVRVVDSTTKATVVRKLAIR